MNPSIPASAIVAVNPGVIGAGGSSLDLNGLILSSGTRVPIGSVLSFASAQDVSDYFGPSSDEAAAAAIYFLGFDNSNVKPGAILLAQYNLTAVAAFLRGASVAALTIPQLQALTGTLIVSVDGATRTGSSFSLSSAVSFSAAAALIQTALNTTTITQATSTATAIAGTTMTVAGTITGAFAVGQTITGAGVTANTVLLAQLTGPVGGAGTYTVSVSQTVGPVNVAGIASPVVVTFDSVSGAFVIASGATGAASTIGFATGTLSASLKLTSATGAVVSQGAAVAVPSVTMGALVQETTNWATFTTLFDPDQGSGNAQKLLLAAWNNTKNNRYMYVPWDTDVTPTLSNDATASLGNILKAANTSGTFPIYSPDYTLAVFECGAVASIDFTETNGRATMAFRGQTGLTPSVTNQTIGNNLIANGYNFYGAYATANDRFVFMYPGLVSGPFKWADSYVNQIWLNNAFQLALMTLLTQAKSVPYNDLGYGLIRAACLDPINAGFNFGAFRAGVPLSSLQAAEVNTAASVKINTTLESQGWYLQILPAQAIVRAARTSPPMTFWYMDGGSVQQISLASVEIQ